jgi:hypothetical protein
MEQGFEMCSGGPTIGFTLLTIGFTLLTIGFTLLTIGFTNDRYVDTYTKKQLPKKLI